MIKQEHRKAYQMIWMAMFFCFWISNLSYALVDDSHPRFEHIGVEQGLSQASVTFMLQDDTGFMWFGTGSGLDRYDGYRFTVFRHDSGNSDSISSNLVQCGYKDAHNQLWIGTNGGGLNHFNPMTQTFTHFRHNPADPSTLSSDVIWSITRDQDGYLWIGTDHGLNRFDPGTGKVVRYRHDPDDPASISHDSILCLYFDAQKRLWVGTQNGLNQYQLSDQSFIRYYHDPANPNSLSHNTVNIITQAADGALWIGTMGGGLCRFDVDKNQFQTFRQQANNPQSLSSQGHDEIMAICPDRFGDIWVGPSAGGLNRLKVKTGTFTHFTSNPGDPSGFKGSGIQTIYEDAGGVIWIGAFLQGINKYDRFSTKFMTMQHRPDDIDSIDSNTIQSLCEDRSGNIWIGTADAKGLNKWDRTTGKIVHYGHVPGNQNSLSNMAVFSIFEDHLGYIWIGTWDGLNQYDPKTGRFEHFRHDPSNPKSISSNSVLSIFEDHQNVLWFGARIGGLSRLDRQTKTFVNFRNDSADMTSIAGNTVKVIFEDRQNTLWVCTDQGVCILDRQRQTFKRLRQNPQMPGSIKGVLVSSILEGSDGFLWFGTDQGLSRYDYATHEFKTYDKAHGLNFDEICGILQDEKGRLWVSTGRGMSVFDPKRETFRNYDLSDGLQGLEFNAGVCLKAKDGLMLFGGSNGLNLFYPDRIRENRYVPPVVLTEFYRFNQPVPFGPDSILKKPVFAARKITLSYRDYVVSFEFAALSYAQSAKNHYAYMMEGFEKTFNQCQDRRLATYTSLPPGNYTFRVKASNNDGYWNDQGTSIKIVVKPPPWKTWWAYTLYAVLLAAIILGYIYRLKKQFEKQRAADQSMRQIKEKLAQAQKMESLGLLAGGIAHDFNNVLSSVMGFAQFCLKNELDQDSPARDSLEEILKAGYRAQDIIKGILTFSRKTDEEKKRIHLTPVITDSMKFLRASIPKTIEIVMDFNAQEDVVFASPVQIGQIVMNLCANAEYAMRNSTGKLTIGLDNIVLESDDRIHYQNIAPGPYVRLVIADTGHGIEPEVIDRIFEPYFTTKPVFEGTGFGLSVVHGIVVDHKGSINVESQIGHGTRFEILLPRVAGAATLEQKSEGPLPRGTERILFVDDEEQIVKWNYKLLTRLGYKVTPMTGSIEALQVFERSPQQFDLVITDLTMPRMTGVDMAQRMLKISPGIAIILCTGFQGLITKEKTNAMGISDLLQKPVDDRKIAQTIRRVLDENGKSIDRG